MPARFGNEPQGSSQYLEESQESADFFLQLGKQCPALAGSLGEGGVGGSMEMGVKFKTCWS